MLKSLLLALLLSLEVPAPLIGPVIPLPSLEKNSIQTLPAREKKETREKPLSTSRPNFIGLREGQSLESIVPLTLSAPEAASVEFYAYRSNSQTPLYLGKGERQGGDTWRFSWDTTHSPNDSYTLFALADKKAEGGEILTGEARKVLTEGQVLVRVANPVVSEKTTPSPHPSQTSAEIRSETPKKRSEELQSAIERIDKEQEILAKKATESLTAPQVQLQRNTPAKKEGREEKEELSNRAKNAPEKTINDKELPPQKTSSETLEGIKKEATEPPSLRSEAAPLEEKHKGQSRKEIAPAAPVILNEEKKEVIEKTIKELKTGSQHIVTAQKIKDLIAEKKLSEDVSKRTQEARQILSEQVRIDQKTDKREDALFQENLKATIKEAKTQEEAVSLVSGEIRALASKNEQAAETIAKTIQSQEGPEKTIPPPSAPEEREATATKVRNEIQEFQQAIQEKQVEKIEILRDALSKDSDKDGLPDIEEFRLGTDYFKADTDQDGYLDGDEINNGYDPLIPSPGDKIDFQEPIKNGAESEDLGILNAELAPRPEKPGEDSLILRGKGFPNTFVTLYIYSTPIIVTVRVNQFGFWEYKLDKPLENGPHKVYVAITDNTGSVTKKSAPFAFVQEARAISIVEASKEKPAQARFLDISGFDSPSLFIIAAALIGIISIIAGIILIGFVHKRSGTE